MVSFWVAVWPNLAADCIWVPLVWGWHHVQTSRLLDKQREHLMRELREHLEN